MMKNNEVIRNPKTILACSDIKTQKTLSDFLSLFGYDIINKTQFGYDCLNEIIGKKPDLVISDIFIYDLDACRLYEQIKEAGMDRNMVFAVLTPVTDSSMINEVLKSGVDLFSLLPTDFVSLDKKIRETITAKRNGERVTIEWIDDEELRITSHIRELLCQLGAPPNDIGQLYIADAVYMNIVNRRYRFLPLSTTVYPKIAKKYNTTPGAIERAIRTVLAQSWQRGNLELINEIFGYTIDPKKAMPTTTIYIATLVQKVKADLKMR